jgi:hypothetical protein
LKKSICSPFGNKTVEIHLVVTRSFRDSAGAMHPAGEVATLLKVMTDALGRTLYRVAIDGNVIVCVESDFRDITEP